MRPPIARALLAAIVVTLSLAACNEGPAERTGKKIDNAGQSLRDAVNPPSGPAQSLGRSIDRATGQ